MSSSLKILRLKGPDIVPYIPDLAHLRIKIFKDYPYLYLGNLEYENQYLHTYVDCPESVMVLVFDQEKVVGVSTAIPLEFAPDFQKPFVDHNMPLKEIFYLGESVLLHEYRGQGVYRHFFEERESAAREYGSKTATFCAVERPQDDPRRPKDYAPLDKIWQNFGYEKHPELCTYFEWQEIDDSEKTSKPMVFWLKKL